MVALLPLTDGLSDLFDRAFPQTGPTARQRRWRAKQRDAGKPPADPKAAERSRRRRERLRAEGKSVSGTKQKDKAKRDARFVGVDGEGGGVDAQGRQIYRLFRAGDRELFRGNKRLSTYDLCEFICSLPKAPIYVGFGFGYDATQILRDLSPEQIRKLFMSDLDKAAAGLPEFRYVYIGGGFAVEYLPQNYLRVARVADVVLTLADGRSVTRAQVVAGSSRTIYETFGFFQCSFVRALARFNIGTLAERKRMAETKATRGGFDKMTKQIRAYNKRECELMAELMERFRMVCYAGGITPRTWNGAGKLAAALHRKNGTPRRKDLELIVPADVREFGRRAYYGGRFEVTRTGRIRGPIYEYDIRSAYPRAMLDLPCLIHGTWQEAKEADLTGELYMAECRYRHGPIGKDAKGRAIYPALCGLPHRSKQHRLSWQRMGQGVYWSCEIDAARRLGATVEIGKAWVYERHCDCKPMAWVEDVYNYRRSIGAKVEGEPIKRAIASLYGKLAQRSGDPPYANPIWAGLITAIVRSRLIDAALSNEAGLAGLGNVVYLATDAVYSTVPLSVPIGEQLGQWEHVKHGVDMFIVQPGLYWGMGCRCPACRTDLRQKTRGVPENELVRAIPEFESAWDAYCVANRAALRPATRDIPKVALHMENFTGLRLASSRGKPETAGRWDPVTREISFDWTGKRLFVSWQGDAVLTRPYDGSPSSISLEYPKAEAAALFTSMAQEMQETFGTLDDCREWTAPGFFTGGRAAE